MDTACCIMFTAIVYLMTGQPLDWNRFIVFMVLSLLVVYIAQSIGYIVGAVFNSVVNGTFAGPILIVPMMMFSGFGVNFRDIPGYLSWGTHLSFLRYSLEGFVGAIYGMDRGILPCEELYCHYRYPDKFMYDVAMRGDDILVEQVKLWQSEVGVPTEATNSEEMANYKVPHTDIKGIIAKAALQKWQTDYNNGDKDEVDVGEYSHEKEI
uniref:ABC2_membrane domain-containing protein n=1 Tax=Rhodnius prolixus TaxID=13249 RepID=T1I3S2_RHOPR